MLRLIFYFLVAYVIWKVIGAVVRMMIGPPQNPAPRRKNPQPSPRQEQPNFRDIKDADFEDITPPRS